jgi:hypothetical protein
MGTRRRSSVVVVVVVGALAACGAGDSSGQPLAAPNSLEAATSSVPDIPYFDPELAGLCESRSVTFAEGEPSPFLTPGAALADLAAANTGLEGLELTDGRIMLGDETVGSYQLIDRPEDTFAVERAQWCYDDHSDPDSALAGSASASATSAETVPPPTTVAAPVGSSGVSLPAARSDLPGEPAVWILDPATSIEPTSSSFVALVTRLGCAGGVTGDVVEPIIETGPNDIVVTFSVAALDSDIEQSCPENDAVPVEVTLDEAIGDRRLLDGACRSGSAAAATVYCSGGADRWKP